ncbi:MAG TPA: universal stress protein [Armatimonadota bacterium]
MIVEARDDTVRLYGDLRENQWLTIKAVTNLLLRKHPHGIIIDCTHLNDVTSDGAETFMDAIRWIEAANARIVVAQLPEPVLATLKTVPGLRSRLPISANVDEARRSMQISGTTDVTTAGGRGILVPLLFPAAAEHAASTACRLGREAKSDIHLAYLLSVPRTMPLNTPLPEEEARAQALLDACEAVVKRYGLRAFRHIQRSRDRNEAVLHLVEALKISTLILSRPPDADRGGEDPTETVLRRAQCEVIIDQMPAAA